MLLDPRQKAVTHGAVRVDKIEMPLFEEQLVFLPTLSPGFAVMRQMRLLATSVSN